MSPLSMSSAATADRELRLEIARLVTRDGVFRQQDAQALYAFVTGASDLSPRQKIEAALSELEGGCVR